MTGIEPNLALVEWRAVQMHRYRRHRCTWVANLVITEVNGGGVFSDVTIPQIVRMICYEYQLMLTPRNH
jgi:hypothetical protein